MILIPKAIMIKMRLEQLLTLQRQLKWYHSITKDSQSKFSRRQSLRIIQEDLVHLDEMILRLLIKVKTPYLVYQGSQSNTSL